jgi:hypothetical protein
MTNHKFIALVVIMIALLGSCIAKPSETIIQTAIAETYTANALLTPTPTFTLTPTKTATVTLTPTPTNTKTPTPTPLPPTILTAQALALTQTKVAGNATATKQAYYLQQTATAQVKSAQATQIAQYKDIDWHELVSYANQHIGEKVKVRIRVFNIVSTTELQGYFAGTYEAVYVKMLNPFSGLYEDNSITVYGTVGGDECFDNAYGAQICQPLLKDAFYEK